MCHRESFCQSVHLFSVPGADPYEMRVFLAVRVCHHADSRRTCALVRVRWELANVVIDGAKYFLLDESRVSRGASTDSVPLILFISTDAASQRSREGVVRRLLPPDRSCPMPVPVVEKLRDSRACHI